jgi:hypothetical protein
VNITPYTAAAQGSIWMYMKDVSHPPAGSGPSKMAEVNHFFLKPDGEREFTDAIRKINDAIGKTNWPVHYFWYTLINGGEGPHFVLVIPHDTWADMAEPEMSFDAMLEKAVGRHDAEELTRAVQKAIKRESTEIIAYRPDLSYRPASK